MKIRDCAATVIVGKLVDHLSRARMKHEQEIFITQVLTTPPLQPIEESASDVHETNRIPDPYIYVVRNGRFYTPGGILVEGEVRRDTELQKKEFLGFQKIQNWAHYKDCGFAVWFSPDCPGKYDASKFIISEIMTAKNQKIIFNRAVLLDMDSQDFLSLANSLSPRFYSANTEDLRENPVFPDQNEFANWFVALSEITSQVDTIEKGLDLKTKTDTYASLNDIFNSVPIYTSNLYSNINTEAINRGLMGSHPGSCTSSGSAFETVLAQAKLMGEYKILKCNCPNCKKKVDAVIVNNRIYCPACKSSAAYHC